MKTIYKVVHFIMIFSATLSLTACVASPGGTGSSADQQPVYTDFSGNWVLSRINGSGYSGARITLQIENNRVSGFSGCNRYFASVERLGDGRVNVGFIGSTKKLCVRGNANQIESAYLGALRRSQYYRVSGNRLVLEGNGSNLVFTH